MASGSRRAPTAWISGGIAVVVVGAGVAVWMTGPGTEEASGIDAPSPTAGAVTTPTPAADPAVAARLDELEAAITSDDAARVAQAFGVTGDPGIDPAAVASMAALDVQLDPSSWVEHGDATASATAVVADATGESSAWDVYFAQRDDGRWVITSTTEATP